MKNMKLKMLGMMLISTIVLTIIPSFTRAAEGNLNAVVLKTATEELVYIQGLESNDFKYAFSNQDDETAPEYKTCDTDSNGENVAKLEKDSNGTTYKYMYIAQKDTNSVIELETLKSITEKEINQVNSLTKRIGVDYEGSSSTVSTKEDGTSVTLTQGQIKITDEGSYEYQLIEIVDKNNTVTTLNETAVELYEQLTNIANANTMYEKLVADITIRDNYQKLMDEATWQPADNKTITQPENSQEGEKFIVLIQKVGAKNVEDQDIQFMTCGRKDVADVDYTNTVVTETVEKKNALPVTGENLILYIAFVIIIIAIIAIAIRMKYLKGKNNGKH